VNAPGCTLQALELGERGEGRFLRCTTCSRLIEATAVTRLDAGRCPDEPEPPKR
jgi:hypothetical protein